MKLKTAISTTDKVVLNDDLEKYHFRKKNRRYYLKAFITKTSRLPHTMSQDNAITICNYIQALRVDLNEGTRIRRERQEYPIKRVDEVIDEKPPTVINMCAVPNES